MISSCALIGGGTIRQELAAEYLELADAYAAVEKYQKAATFYERAAKHPGFFNATQYKLARMYALLGKWADAVLVLEPLYLQEPDNILLSNSYAFALVSSGQLEKAFPIYERNYNENKANPVQALNYAEILLLAERYDDATATIAVLREQFGDVEPMNSLDDLEKRIKSAVERKAKEAEKSQKAGTGTSDDTEEASSELDDDGLSDDEDTDNQDTLIE